MRFCLYYEFSALSGRTFGFHKQNSILGGLRRKVEVRGSPGHQETRQCAKTGNTRPCIKTHGRAHKKPQAPGHQKCGTATPCLVARPCHHARVAVRPTHGRAWGVRCEINFSRCFSFWGGSFHSGFSSFFSFGFRV